LRHIVLTSLALCCLRQLLRMLGSRLSLLTDRRKAALRSLLGSEAALQGLDGLLAPRSLIVVESNWRTVQVLGFHGR
jgi:hypothetical protein